MFISACQKLYVPRRIQDALVTSKDVRNDETVEMADVRCSIWVEDRCGDIVWFRY